MSAIFPYSALAFGIVRGVYDEKRLQPVGIFMSLATPLDAFAKLGTIQNFTLKDFGMVLALRPLMLASLICIGRQIGSTGAGRESGSKKMIA